MNILSLSPVLHSLFILRKTIVHVNHRDVWHMLLMISREVLLIVIVIHLIDLVCLIAQVPQVIIILRTVLVGASNLPTSLIISIPALLLHLYRHTLIIHPGHLRVIRHQVAACSRQLMDLLLVLHDLIPQFLNVFLACFTKHARDRLFRLLCCLFFRVTIKPEFAGQHTAVFIFI